MFIPYTLVHEGGFRIDKDFRDNWAFIRPDGIAVPDVGYRLKDVSDEDIGDTDYDPPADGLLSVIENLASKPPPVYLH